MAIMNAKAIYVGANLVTRSYYNSARMWVSELIDYLTEDGKFSYFKDDNSNIVIDNKGSGNYSNDLLLNSGRGIELDATQYVDIPIHHTLGADEKKLATSVDTGWTDNLDNTYTGTAVTGDIVGVSTSSTGTFKVTITLSSVTGGDVEGYTADGTYTFEETLSAPLNLTGTGFTGVVEVVSVEEITNPNSYLTYFDLTAKEFVTLGNGVDGGSSKELVTNGNFDTGDLLGWSTIRGTASVINGEALVTRTSDVQYGEIRQTPTILAGKRYKVNVNYKKGSSVAESKIELYFLGASTTIYATTTEGIYSFDFTASGYCSRMEVRVYADIDTYNIVDSISVKEILPISTTYRFTDGTYNNIITHKTEWDVTDKAKIEVNPNLVGKLALSETGGIDELSKTLDEDDAWYPGMEKSGGYLVDARAGYGVEEVTNNTFNGNTGWVATGTTVTFDNELVITKASTGIPFTGQVDALKKAGQHYIVTIEINTSVTTSLDTRFYYGTSVGNATSGAIIYLNETLSVQSYIVKPALDNMDITIQMYDTTVGSTITIPSISIREATAEEIVNYVSTVRSNADFQTSGVQTTAFVRDALGVPQSYDDTALNWGGDGYGDTQWVPPVDEDWSIEVVLPKASVNTYEGIGIENSHNGLWIRRNKVGYINTRLGLGNEISASSTEELIHATIVHTANTTDVLVYYTGQYKGTSSDIDVNIVSTFTLGKINQQTDKNMNNPLSYFKVHDKALTAEEALEAYNTWIGA